MLGRKFGRVTQSVVFYGDTDQRHRGAGKVTYASPTECHAAKLALQDARVEGHTLRVSFWSGAAKRDEDTRQRDRLAMALLGERIAYDALQSIALGADASQCQQARQAIQAIDDLERRRAELLEAEKIANAKVAAEAAARWIQNLETRKVAMECRLRKVIRQELREEMIRHLQGITYSGAEVFKIFDDSSAASEASDDSRALATSDSDDSIYLAKEVADIHSVADNVDALRASEHDSSTCDLHTEKETESLQKASMTNVSTIASPSNLFTSHTPAASSGRTGADSIHGSDRRSGGIFGTKGGLCGFDGAGILGSPSGAALSNFDRQSGGIFIISPGCIFGTNGSLFGTNGGGVFGSSSSAEPGSGDRKNTSGLFGADGGSLFGTKLDGFLTSATPAASSGGGGISSHTSDPGLAGAASTHGAARGKCEAFARTAALAQIAIPAEAGTSYPVDAVCRRLQFQAGSPDRLKEIVAEDTAASSFGAAGPFGTAVPFGSSAVAGSFAKGNPLLQDFDAANNGLVEAEKHPLPALEYLELPICKYLSNLFPVFFQNEKTRSSFLMLRILTHVTMSEQESTTRRHPI